MPMLYLNVRHTLPMIGIQAQKNTLDSSINQPRYAQQTQQARSNRGATQPKLFIDSYPSQHGQQGFADVSRGTSKHTQMAWALAEDGPKPGRQVALEFIRNDVKSIADQNRCIVAQAIPDPEIRFDVGEAVGTPTIGRTTPQWHTDAQARIHYNRGSIETYLQQKGDIHRWVSEGKYDIRA